MDTTPVQVVKAPSGAERWRLIAEVVDVCEGRAGALSGESRTRIERACIAFCDAVRPESGQCRCAACDASFALPAVAICPVCGSRQVRRA